MAFGADPPAGELRRAELREVCARAGEVERAEKSVDLARRNARLARGHVGYPQQPDSQDSDDEAATGSPQHETVDVPASRSAPGSPQHPALDESGEPQQPERSTPTTSVPCKKPPRFSVLPVIPPPIYRSDSI